MGVSANGIARISAAITSGTTTGKRITDVVENLKRRGITKSGGLAVSLILNPEEKLSERATGEAPATPAVDFERVWASIPATDQNELLRRLRVAHTGNPKVLEQIAEAENGGIVPKKMAKELISMRGVDARS